MSRGAADTIDIRSHQTAPRDVIALGIPTFGMVSVWFMARLYNLRMPMNRIVRQFYVVGKEVGEARNEIVAKALAIDQEDPSRRCSHVLFLDDDVLVHPDALLKLLSHQRPIISGLYFAKTSVPQPLVLSGEFGGTARSWTPGETVECWAHGMGCTLIEAEVFRRVRDELDIGVDAHGYPAWFTTTRDGSVIGPDGTPIITNQTEDVSFLRKAADLGYQPAVDTSAQTFAWHWAQPEQRAYPLKQWAEWQQTGRITWDTDGDPVVWAA